MHEQAVCFWACHGFLISESGSDPGMMFAFVLSLAPCSRLSLSECGHKVVSAANEAQAVRVPSFLAVRLTSLQPLLARFILKAYRLVWRQRRRAKRESTRVGDSECGLEFELAGC